MNQSHCYKVQALILKLKHSVVIKVTENYLISETVTHLNTNWAIIVSFERVCVCVCVGGGGGGHYGQDTIYLFRPYNLWTCTIISPYKLWTCTITYNLQLVTWTTKHKAILTLINLKSFIHHSSAKTENNESEQVNKL